MTDTAKIARVRRALEVEKSRRNAHHFIFDSGHLATKDEHDAKDPVKRVPDIPYLRVLLDCYLVSGRLISPEDAKYALDAGMPLAFLCEMHALGMVLVEKSRDVFVTNLTCCYLFWRARSLDHQKILVQSKKEEDAAPLVFNKEPQFGRMSFMEMHLPRHLRKLTFPSGAAYGNLYFPNGSQVRAIPEGGHIIRSEHPSVIFSDEAAFQPEFGAAYTAAMPACEGGGQFIAVSSAEPGAFEEIVQSDAERGVPRNQTNIPGLSYAIVSGTIPLLRIHYSADPAKRPGTVEGDAWREQAAKRYPGGVSSARWRKEMEIEYRALGGTKAIPQWETWKTGPIVVQRINGAEHMRLYGSYDHGWDNPAAFHVHGINSEGKKFTLWEFYADRVPLSFIARMMKGEKIMLPTRADARIDPDRVVWEGNPYAGKLQFIVADPSLWAEDQPMKDEPNKSLAELFEREGVWLEKGERGGDQMVLSWLLGELWADPNDPKYIITAQCPWLIWELGEQRFKQHSAQVALNQNAPDVLVDKNNHAWDGLKMWLKRFPPAAPTPKPAATPGNFAWWRRAAIKSRLGQPVGTYRREIAR
ncbi:MAG TPA: hypothetical protein VEA38_22075 [Terriglobales bacterium]|nr:hypothetical protein [Terriglobales bacterium]